MPRPAVNQHALHDGNCGLLLVKNACAGIQAERCSYIGGQVNVCCGETVGSLFRGLIMSGYVLTFIA